MFNQTEYKEAQDDPMRQDEIQVMDAELEEEIGFSAAAGELGLMLHLVSLRRPEIVGEMEYRRLLAAGVDNDEAKDLAAIAYNQAKNNQENM